MIDPNSVVDKLKKEMDKYPGLKWTYKVQELLDFKNEKKVYFIAVYGHTLIKENEDEIEIGFPPKIQCDMRVDSDDVNDDIKEQIINKLKEITLREYIKINEAFKIS